MLAEASSPHEKIEGLALTRSGNLWTALDNDGGEVESKFVDLGKLRQIPIN